MYRQRRRRGRPARATSATGTRLAVWQADVSGLDWIDALPPEDHVLLAVDGGYPRRDTARASAVAPVLLAGPPSARPVWHVGSGGVIVDRTKWPGRTVVDEAAIAECSPDEWLVIEAWDES